MSAKKNKEHTKASAGKNHSANALTGRAVFLLIFSLCLVLYGNTSLNGYSMDDDLVVKDHPLVKMGLKGIPKIFKSRYAKNEKQNYEYRPIVVSTFAIEHQLFGERPGISHLINALIYAFCAWLIFQITGQMFIHHHWAIPLLTTLLFIVHPIHTEVVASLKNRDELLVMIFSLLSLRSFLRYADQPSMKSLFLGVVWLVIAGFAKKSALVYIGLIPLSLYFFKGFSGKKLIGSIASLLLGFLIVRLIFLWVAIEHPGERTLQAFENPMFADPVALHDRIPIMAHTTYFYIQKMILPYPLSVYYGYDTVSLPGWTDFAGWGSVLLMSALIGVLIYRMKKKEIWVFGALFFLMGISMFSNLVPAVGIVAERFAFQASLGFSILVAVFLSKWVGEEKSIRGLVKSKGGYILLLIMIPSSVWTIVRNQDWKSTGSIYLSDIQHMERSAKLNSLLGAYYADQLEMARSGKKPLSPQDLRQKADSSAMFFARALEIFPDYAACSNNLGTIVFNFNNNIDSARACFLKAVKIDTLYTQAYFNLASTYEQDMAMYDLLRSSCGKAKFSSLDSVTGVVNGSELHEIKKYFRSGSRLEKYLIAYLNSIIQSGSMEKVNSAFSGFPQDAKAKISEFYSASEIRPNADTLTKYFVEKGGAFIRNEIYGQPNDIIRFVVSTTLSYSIAELAAKDKVDPVLLQDFANQQYRDATDKALDSYNKALLSKPDFLSAFDKLNNGYSTYGMYDSVISLNRRYIGNPKYFQEQLYANIGLAQIQLGKISDGIVSLEKAVAINEQNLYRLGIIYTHLGNARNPGFPSAEKWYSGKRRELMNMFNLLSLKNSEIGQLERADHYRKLSEQYSK